MRPKYKTHGRIKKCLLDPIIDIVKVYKRIVKILMKLNLLNMKSKPKVKRRRIFYYN